MIDYDVMVVGIGCGLFTFLLVRYFTLPLGEDISLLSAFGAALFVLIGVPALILYLLNKKAGKNIIKAEKRSKNNDDLQ